MNDDDVDNQSISYFMLRVSVLTVEVVIAIAVTRTTYTYNTDRTPCFNSNVSLII